MCFYNSQKRILTSSRNEIVFKMAAAIRKEPANPSSPGDLKWLPTWVVGLVNQSITDKDNEVMSKTPSL